MDYRHHHHHQHLNHYHRHHHQHYHHHHHHRHHQSFPSPVMYRWREDVYSFRDILSFPQFSQKKRKTKEKDLTRILVQQPKTGNEIGWTISWNHIVFCQPEPLIFAFSHWNTRKVYSYLNNLYSENADLLHIFKKLFSLSFLSIYIFLPNKMTLQIFSSYTCKRCNALKFEFPAILSLKIWVSWWIRPIVRLYAVIDQRFDELILTVNRATAVVVFLINS